VKDKREKGTVCLEQGEPGKRKGVERRKGLSRKSSIKGGDLDLGRPYSPRKRLRFRRWYERRARGHNRVDEKGGRGVRVPQKKNKADDRRSLRV